MECRWFLFWLELTYLKICTPLKNVLSASELSAIFLVLIVAYIKNGLNTAGMHLMCRSVGRLMVSFAGRYHCGAVVALK